ncbi:MAG: hypothetical protein JO171_03695 [Paludibacterium sp.]|uniref:hypothetical protein n=1 Tax=Paludibacterium sp. TaxID=1917523 RepID=UPI0025F5447A|nr:hypothetical protein [Paludibacterium sp.]MBV8046228.1 hypothetical protein [Paludibacterium sp.]MBV8649452.1 hypothetical protein [Paludibacterium sp.]
MARPDKISRFLPISFANGTKVRRFAKHCPRCGTMVTADTMHGIAYLLENRIFVAAKAACPACQKRFSVACVITDNRHVHRVLAPDWLFALWLRMAVRNQPQPVHHREWELPDEPVPVAQGLVLSDSEQIVHSEEILGKFDGTPISSWIEYQGQRYHFERAAPPGGIKLGADQILFDGKLIYQLKA